MVGKWKNVLVRATTVKSISHDQKSIALTLKETREEENKKAVGGLRNPQSAVSKNLRLRQTGMKIRQVLEQHMREEEIDALASDMKKGTSMEWVREVRGALCTVFKAQEDSKGLQADLWRAILEEADDADKSTLPEWMTWFSVGNHRRDYTHRNISCHHYRLSCGGSVTT